MSWRSLPVVACAVMVVWGAAAVASAKTPAPITGKLTKAGYTVVALASNGKAASVRAKTGSFKLRPPASRGTLHLRAPNGTYAGPIVVGRKRRDAILGVTAGARLGTIRVRDGYATPGRRLAKKWVVAAYLARARNGVPIGAGKTGLVRSKSTRSGTAINDNDLDGVPNSLDIDDDGDLILDDYDQSTYRKKTASASSVADPTFPGGSRMSAFTSLNTRGTGVQSPVNVNGGSSDEQIAAAQQEYGVLTLGWWAGSSAEELDCGALVYCSLGGTGRLQTNSTTFRADAPPFPACCDGNHNGLGSLTATRTTVTGFSMDLFPGATTEQMRAGDVLIERATVNGAAVQSAVSLGFVFATHSVLASYDDGQGDSRTFSYPQANECTPPNCGGVYCIPPNCALPVPVRAGPNGDVVVRLRFWRPQRPHTTGDAGTGKWMDVGNLVYGTRASPLVFVPGGGAPHGNCPQSSYSDIDPNLTPDTLSDLAGGPPWKLDRIWYLDHRGDQPSNPANTFSYTLNLTQCLAADGLAMNTNGLTTVYFNSFAVHDSTSGFSGEIPVRTIEAETTSSVTFRLQP